MSLASTSGKTADSLSKDRYVPKFLKQKGSFHRRWTNLHWMLLKNFTGCASKWPICLTRKYTRFIVRSLLGFSINSDSSSGSSSFANAHVLLFDSYFVFRLIRSVLQVVQIVISYICQTIRKLLAPGLVCRSCSK